MDAYAKLRQMLEQIPLIDDHSHVLHHNIESPLWEGPYPVLPLTRVLLDFNTRSCFTNPGLTESQVADCLMGRISPEEQKQLLTAPHCKNRTVYRYLMEGLRKLYDLDIWEINADNFDRVNAALEGRGEDFYGLLDRIFTAGNVKCSVLNLWSGKCRIYLTDYQKRLSPAEKALDQKYFVFSTTLDAHAMDPFGPVTAGYAQDFGMATDTLEHYTALLEQICRWSVEQMGVKAFKNTEMYFRRLDYRVRSLEEAAPCYKPDRTPEEDRILSDYIACTVFRMAGQLGVPVQLHTGSIWGGFNMTNISPEHLAEVICAFPDTKFDLLHCGDPFFGVTALMGSNFPNVYVNMSAMPKNSLCNFRHWLDVYLDRVPSRKITLGWDEFTPEMVLADAAHTRDVVAQVLADKVTSGLYSYDLALEIAHDIMHRTAESLYKIKEN